MKKTQKPLEKFSAVIFNKNGYWFLVMVSQFSVKLKINTSNRITKTSN